MQPSHDPQVVPPVTQPIGLVLRPGTPALSRWEVRFPGGESVVRVVTSVDSPLECSLAIPPGHRCAVHVHRGASVVFLRSRRDLLLPQQSAVIPESESTTFRLGRGDHDLILFYVPLEYMAGLARWQEEAHGPDCEHGARVYHNIGRGTVATPDAEDLRDLGRLYAWVAGLCSVRPTSGTAHLVPDSICLGTPFAPLLSAVRSAPGEDWSIQRAADMVSYSRCHFSRTFRAVTGIGFPHFVDACRTEAALARIVYTQDPLEVVAYECGLGSPSGMRTAFKEHTGLLPSEMRTYLA